MPNKAPKKFDRNLIVIGGGAAGLVSAYIAATVRAKVTLVEHHKLGGDCLNYGCVPSKALITAAKVAHIVREAPMFGVDASIDNVDFPKLMDGVYKAIERIEPHDSAKRYESLGVEVIQGFATIVDPWHIRISSTDAAGEDVLLSTRAIILATGAAPIIPDVPGLRDVPHFTSETLWAHLRTLKKRPSALAILGGGPIGCELAQSFARLGSKVSLIDRGDRLLKSEDAEACQAVLQALQSEGVEIFLNSSLTGAATLSQNKQSRFTVSCNKQDLPSSEAASTNSVVQREIDADFIIVAVGRRARLKGFGLEALGIDPEKPLRIDEHMQTEVDSIFAAGDVAGRYQFTHVAAHEAWYASVNSLFGFVKRFKADYTIIPRAIYTQPEVARVGLSEKELTDKGIDFETTRFDLTDLDRQLLELGVKGELDESRSSTDQTPSRSATALSKSFVKVFTKPGKDTILGATIVSNTASENVVEFVSAMKWKRGLNDILGTIHAYPTHAEGNKYAAGEWKKANKPGWLLSLAEKLHRVRR